jgi:hypothetical protein
VASIKILLFEVKDYLESFPSSLAETLPKKQEQEQLSSSSPQRKSPPKKSKGIRLLNQTTKDSRKSLSQKKTPIRSENRIIEEWRTPEDGTDHFADVVDFIVWGDVCNEEEWEE